MQTFKDLLQKHKKIVIAGGPKVGKTSLSWKCKDGRDILSTDDFMDLDWGEVPAAVIGAVKDRDEWLVEGVQAARCLRKGLKPDIVIWLDKEHVPTTRRQKAMAKAVKTVFTEWESTSDIQVIRDGNDEHIKERPTAPIKGCSGRDYTHPSADEGRDQNRNEDGD